MTIDHRPATIDHRASTIDRSAVATILIVEDSPDNMKLFRTLLTLRKHEIVPLTSGEGLLEAVGQMHPALVLMDIQLPGKDGYALLKELRQSEHKGVRVVALTAHAMSGDREKAINAGFDGYITKPIDIRAFPDQISRALDGEMVTT
jgi:two-component system cell cycle response regulator DivK